MVSTLHSSASSAFRLPWTQWRRGLLVAAVLSMLVHGLTFNALHQNFDFKFNERSGTASLNTRVIQAPSETEAGVQPQPKSQPKPISQPAQQRAAQAAPATAPSQPTPAVSPPVPAPELRSEPSVDPPAASAPTAAPTPQDPQNLEQNRQIAGENTDQDATETIALPTPNVTPAAGQGSAAAQPSMAVKLQYPPNTQLEFEALSVRRGQTNSGSGQLSWKSNGGDYDLQIESTAFGLALLTQKSVGSLDTMGLAPERYSDKRFNRSEQAAHFRRAQGLVQFSNNKPEAPIVPGIQDRLSVMLQIAGIIGGDPQRYEVVNRIVVPVAGVDAVEEWEFSLDKALDITVPAANMRAVKLTRKPRKEFDQKLELWLAPQLGYLPIRIRQTDEQNPEGNFTELSLKRLP